MSSVREIRWTMFIVTAIGNFIAMLDSTTVNLALYPMSQDFGISLSHVQWVMVGYMLILTVFLPFFGKLGDIFPKNKLYSIGFAVFSFGAIMSFLSQSFGFLIFMRCIEALGASVMLSNAQAIIATVFKNARRGKALGINGCLIAIGGMLGPSIGGLLINNFGWHSVFLPCIPVAIFGIYYAYKILPSHVMSTRVLKFDFVGFVLFTLSLFSILLLISKGYNWGWISDKVIILLISALLFGVLFYIREHKISYPMINFSLFKIRTFIYGNLSVMFSYMAMFTSSILLPFYLMEILKYNAFKAGILILPYSLTLAFVAPVSGYLAGKFGSRHLTLAGPCVYILALLCYTTFDINTAIWQIVLVSGLLGIGNGMFQSPSNTAIMTSVQKKDLGIASGILSLSRNMGNILGIAITITVFETLKHILVNTQSYIMAFMNAFHLTICVGIIFGILCLSFSFIAYKPKI